MMAIDYLMEDYVFRSFAFYATLSILKMIYLHFKCSRTRAAKGVFANPEDITIAWKRKGKLHPIYDDEVIERIRRNHINDLENIIPFCIMGAFYVISGPGPTISLWHFRAFFFSRLFHTFSYQFGLQPFRGVSFLIGMIVNLSMALQILYSMW